jgi:hypothetical protein
VNPAPAATAVPFVPKAISVRLTGIDVRRTSARSPNLYVVVEATADGKAQRPLVLEMPQTDDKKTLLLGMNNRGFDMYTYDALAPESKGKAPPRHIEFRLRVYRSEAAFRQVAEGLRDVAKALNRVVPELGKTGPQGLIAGAIGTLGVDAVAGGLMKLGNDDLEFDWLATLDATEKGELGDATAFQWYSDTFGVREQSADGFTVPSVCFRGGVVVQ